MVRKVHEKSKKQFVSALLAMGMFTRPFEARLSAVRVGDGGYDAAGRDIPQTSEHVSFGLDKKETTTMRDDSRDSKSSTQRESSSSSHANPNSVATLTVAVRTRTLLLKEQLRGIRKDVLRVMDERTVVVLDPDDGKLYLDRRGN